MNPFFIIYVFISFCIHIDAYLSIQQLKYIQNILIHPNSSPEIILQTKQILAEHYIPWALKQYNVFRIIHSKKLKNIKNQDLRQYAIYGLLESIHKYNGKTPLPRYAKKYVLGRLHQGITILTPMKPQSHSDRMAGIQKVPIQFVSYDNRWIFDISKECSQNINPNVEKYSKGENRISIYNSHTYLEKTKEMEKIKRVVDTLDYDSRRLFYYRYDKEILQELRTTTEVSKIMGFSNETYRRKMNKILEQIRNSK